RPRSPRGGDMQGQLALAGYGRIAAAIRIDGHESQISHQLTAAAEVPCRGDPGPPRVAPRDLLGGVALSRPERAASSKAATDAMPRSVWSLRMRSALRPGMRSI